MKNTIKFAAKLAALVLVIAFSVAACGGGGSTDEGIKTPAVGDYVVGNMTQTDDNITPVTITPKPGKSTGAIKIFYKGSSKLPKEKGAYDVTFDVAEAKGWDYVSGLFAGTLTINEGVRWAKVANSTFGISSAVKGVAWGNNVFVAVGAGGKIAYSADGKTWTAAANSPFGNSTINCVAWGDGKFIAGGDDAKMASSDDGITWTPISNTGFTVSSTAYAVNGIVYGSDKWVAVGKNRLAYSATGTTWTASDSNAPFNYEQGSPNLLGVAFGEGRFVLVGAAGGQGHGSSLAYSNDGISWTKWDSSAVGDNITSVCFGNNKFVAIALDMILYSENAGIDWAAVTLPESPQVYAVAAKAGRFIAVGAYGAIFYSNDCVNWTTNKAAEALSANHFYSVVYGSGNWVATGLNGVIAYLEE